MHTWGRMYEQCHDYHSEQDHIYAKIPANDHHLEHGYNGSGVDHYYAAALSSPQSPAGDAPAEACFTRQQIKEHNAKVGWQQWITLKGSVYHTTGFRDHFIAYNKKKAAEKRGEAGPAAEAGNTWPTAASHCEQRQERGPEHGAGGRTARSLGRHFSHDSETDSSKEKGTSEQIVRNSCGNEVENKMDDDDEGDEVDDEEDDDEEDGDEDKNDTEDTSSHDAFLWQYDVIAALRKSGLGMAEIETEIGPFKIGTLENRTVPSWKFWESIRADVIALHDDIANRRSDDVSAYEREYLCMLQRWLRKYRDMDPIEKHPGGDGNTNIFFLTHDPDTLRDWIRASPPLDTELPASGAWVCPELPQLSPLGDTHDVFTSSLRSHHSDDKRICYDIQGDVAWEELPDDVIHCDQMTENQQAVHETRAARGDSVYNPERMKRRRARLRHYFMSKYQFSAEKMAGFLQWATVMEKNERELCALCLDNV